MALKLAEDPGLLVSLKAKLAENRGGCALFNAERFARHIEAAYAGMWERAQRGEAPESFAVAPIAT
jgi:protein O-GlcNAc transferase